MGFRAGEWNDEDAGLRVCLPRGLRASLENRPGGRVADPAGEAAVPAGIRFSAGCRAGRGTGPDGMKKR